MRVLWISLLLVGSITCEPLYPGGPQGPSEKPGHPGSASYYTGSYTASGPGSIDSTWYLASSGGSQGPHEKPAEKPGFSTSGFPGSYYSSGSYPASGAGSFSSFGSEQFGGQSQPASSGSSSFSSFRPPAGSGIFSSGSQQGSQSGSPGSHQQSAQGGLGSSSDGGDQEPDFTSVSPGDQVSARKSRSHYKKHNYRFFQQFYTQTEPVEPQGPIFPHHGKTSGHSKGQVQRGF